MSATVVLESETQVNADLSEQQPPKPLLRGWLHAVMAPVMLLMGLVLMIFANSWLVRFSMIFYILTGVLMFANSAIYHRFNWSKKHKAIFRRLDHSFIFTFIAGTYTPLCFTILDWVDRIVLISVIWGCALAGVLFKMFWLSAPRKLYTTLYVIMGWAAIFWLIPLWNTGGPQVVIPVVVGGVIYTLGALVYSHKRPDPWPTVFGFHEIFHLCTILAAISQYVAIVFAVISTL